MAKFRKLAAMLACVMMASSAAGCGNTQPYSAKVGDNDVKAGVYIAYVNTLLTNELNSLYYQGITEDPFSQQIEGVSLSQYVKNEALQSLKEYCAIANQFGVEGLSITDDEMKAINNNLRESWDNMGDYYEYEGVSKESLKELYLTSLKREKLFDHYYDKDGKEAVSDEALKKFFDDNYLRYKVITFYTTTQSTEEDQKAEDEKKQKERDEFFEKGKDLSFEEFDELIAEYKEYSKAQSSSSDDSSSDSSDSSSGSSSDASSDASGDSSADESDASSADSSEDSDDSQASTDSSSEDGSSDESSDASEEDSSSQSQNDSSSADKDDDDEEDDPYINEVIINTNNYKDDTESPSGKLFKFLNELEIGKVSKFENDYGYYIVIKGDVTERGDYVEDNRDSVLHALKDEDFSTLLNGWIAAAPITIYDSVIKRYTPEVIYDRINAYYEKTQN